MHWIYIEKSSQNYGYFFYKIKIKNFIGKCLQNDSKRLLYRYKVIVIVYYNGYKKCID